MFLARLSIKSLHIFFLVFIYSNLFRYLTIPIKTLSDFQKLSVLAPSSSVRFFFISVIDVDLNSIFSIFFVINTSDYFVLFIKNISKNNNFLCCLLSSTLDLKFFYKPFLRICLFWWFFYFMFLFGDILLF